MLKTFCHYSQQLLFPVAQNIIMLEEDCTRHLTLHTEMVCTILFTNAKINFISLRSKWKALPRKQIVLV